VRNCRFHEDLTEDGQVCDHRLRSGPGTTRDALRILEREGYPPTVLERARAYLDRSTDPTADGG